MNHYFIYRSKNIQKCYFKFQITPKVVETKMKFISNTIFVSKIFMISYFMIKVIQLFTIVRFDSGQHSLIARPQENESVFWKKGFIPVFESLVPSFLKRHYFFH